MQIEIAVELNDVQYIYSKCILRFVLIIAVFYIISVNT